MRIEVRAFASLTVANLKMYLRNPIASFSLWAALVLLLVAVKVVFGGGAPHTRLVVVNSSSSADAATLLADLRSVGTFDVTEASSPAAAHRLLEDGKADLEVVIPSSFLVRDASGGSRPVRLQVTYRPGSAGESSLPLLRGVVASFDETALNQIPSVSVAASTLQQARASSAIDFLLPGLVTFNIIGSALMLAAGVFANHRATGVLRRLKATGVGASIFVLSHAASTGLLGTVQTAGILLAASLLFTIHLDLPALFLLLAMGYLVFLAMGLAISGWVKDPQRATAIAQGVAFPMIFVGLLAPELPSGIAEVARFLPVSYVTDGMQQLGQGGALSSVGPDLAWLTAWAVVLLACAGRLFRWD